MFFLAFVVVFLILWALFYVAAPGLQRALTFAGSRLARLRVYERLKSSRVGAFAAYAPVVAILILGGLFTAWAGDGFADLAEAVQSKSPKLAKLDMQVHSWAATRHSADATLFFTIMTNIGGPVGAGAIAGIAGIALAIKRRWRWLMYLGVTAGGGALMNMELKRYFSRARPDLAEALRRAHGYSFPSGHAMGSTVVFGALAYLAFRMLPRWRWKAAALALALTLIAAVSLSRVYLGVHWISDVVAGVFIGMTWVVVTTVAYETLRRVRALRSR